MSTSDLITVISVVKGRFPSWKLFEMGNISSKQLWIKYFEKKKGIQSLVARGRYENVTKKL